MDCLYPRRLSKKKEERSHRIKNPPLNRVLSITCRGDAPGLLSTTTSFKVRRAKGPILFSQRGFFDHPVRRLYWILDLLLLPPNSPNPRPSRSPAPNDRLSTVPVFLYGDDLRPFCLTWPWILNSLRTRTVRLCLPTRFLLDDADHTTLWPRPRLNENQ